MVTCETNCCSHRAFPTLEISCLRDKLWKWFKCFASKQDQMQKFWGFGILESQKMQMVKNKLSPCIGTIN